jgi:hypothetical protein
MIAALARLAEEEGWAVDQEAWLSLLEEEGQEGQEAKLDEPSPPRGLVGRESRERREV